MLRGNLDGVRILKELMNIIGECGGTLGCDGFSLCSGGYTLGCGDYTHLLFSAIISFLKHHIFKL